MDQLKSPYVGERRTFSDGTEIECFEVYDDHGIPTGKWRDVPTCPNASEESHG